MSDTCPVCNSTDISIVVEDAHPTTWGTDGVTEHGRHTFIIRDEYFKCANCDEQWYDMGLARKREALLNEAIKAKLGIDWLAESKARRQKWKEKKI